MATTHAASVVPSVTPSPTVQPSPTAEPTATPTSAPLPTATPSAPSSVAVTAKGLAFLETHLFARAGDVTVVLSNLDSGVPHNVSIDGLGVTGDCTGPCSTTLSFTAAPGDYAFHCTFHPDMTGSLTLVP